MGPRAIRRPLAVGGEPLGFYILALRGVGVERISPSTGTLDRRGRRGRRVAIGRAGSPAGSGAAQAVVWVLVLVWASGAGGRRPVLPWAGAFGPASVKRLAPVQRRFFHGLRQSPGRTGGPARSITPSLGRGGPGQSRPGCARRDRRTHRPSSAALRAARFPALAGFGPALLPHPSRSRDRGKDRGPPGLFPAEDGERPC